MSAKAGKIKKSTYLAWPTRTISYAVGACLFGSITFYATDVMQLSAATVGIIFMISKIFDGFTDFVFGYFVDKLNLKSGKGRPFEFAIIGYWLTLVLMFSAPNLGINMSYIYLFIMYTLNVSVFTTMLTGCESVYLSNVVEKSEQSVSILSVTGIVSMIITIIASMIFPQLIAAAGTDKAAWTKFAIVIAIPMTVFGLIRFMVVKERHSSDAKASQKFTLKEMLSLLRQNKYILIYALISLLANFGTNFTNATSTYYYKYIMGDIGIGSIMALSMLSMVIAIGITPLISKKIGFVNTIRTYTVIGFVGYLLRLVSPSSIPVVFFANILSYVGYYPMFAMSGSFIIDCIDYGEWKTGKRSQGTIASAQTITSKIGQAIGVGGVGILMALSGYNGALAVQSSLATTVIVLEASVIPAIFLVIQFILLRLFDLDKKLPQIRKDLEQRRIEN
ncbi:MAG: MFS transporter [Suipraeoptans sp.]